MSTAHEVLSYVVSADDKASTVFRGVGAEITKLTTNGKTGLQGLNKEFTALGNHKPLSFVKAEQTAELARTEAQMAKLQKTTQAAGVATKLQAAELDVLARKHQSVQRELAATASAHHTATKVATASSVAIVGGAAAVVAGVIKQGTAWTDLGKEIEQQTGISGKSLDRLMGSINAATGTVPYKLDEVAQAAVLLRTRFGESDAQIAKTSGLMVGFAHRAGVEVTPAVQGLSNILRQYREPLSDVVGLTDKLVSVSQLTQQPLGAMESTIERFGPKLQAMGFGLNESIRLMGILGASGVKADQMGRGLATAYGAAQKALGGAAGPQAALDKQSEAVQKAQDHLTSLGATIPKTTAQQVKHTLEVKHANEALDSANAKYSSLKKVVDAAGGSHATVSGIIKSEIGQIEHATSKQEAYSIAAGAFGKQVGPSFARAFYHNKDAVEAVDKALGQHGSTQKLVEAEQKEFLGKTVELEEAWHKTERTLGKDLIPALKSFLGLLSGGVKDIEKFTKGNASLVEGLGALATVGAGAFLLRKPLAAAAGGLSHLPGLGGLAKIPGVGGAGQISGIRGSAMPGSLTNPIMVRVEGGSPNGLPGGPSTPARAGGEGLLSRAAGAGRAAGGTALAIEGLNIALPGNTTSKGLPTHGSGLGGQFKGWIHDSSEAFTKGFSDILGGKIGQALDDIFGHNRVDDLRKFGDELKKVKTPLEDLPSAQMQKIHEEAVALGHDKSLSKWAPQLEAIAQATDPVEIALRKAGGSFTRLRYTAEKELGLLSAHTPPLVKAGTDAAARAFAILVGAIRREMAAGVKSTAQGTAEIHKILTQQLRSLGISNTTATQTKSGKFGPGPGSGGNPLQPTGVGEPQGFTGLEGATGARVPGRPGPDNWTLVDPAGRAAAKVAGAELLIANRHTEADASVATKLVYGKTLGQMVAGERTPHSASASSLPRRATGGYVFPFPKGEQFGWDRIDQGQDLKGPPGGPVLAIGPGTVSVGHDAFSGFGPSYPVEALSGGPWLGRPVYYGHAKSTRTGPVHAGDVIGITQSRANEWTAAPAGWLELGFTSALGHGIQGQGAAVAPMLHALAAGHMVAGGAAGFKAITAPKTHVHGLIGKIAQATLNKITAAANRKLEGAAGAPGAPGALPHGGGGTNSQNEALGKRMMVQAGWPASEWPFLQALWTQESGWNANSVNPSSGAYGIPQALGHGHPFNLGDPAAQIAWGLNYIRGRYGSPAGAEAHEKRFNWYEKGGRLNYAGAFGQGGSVTASSPTMAIFGDKGTETATFTPHAALGTRVGGAGLAETPGNNPDTGTIEYHTQEEWAEIRRQHTARLKREHHGPKGKAPTYEDLVKVGGIAAGSFTSTSHQTVNLDSEKGIQKIATATWTKVVAAIEKTLRTTSDDRVAVAITGKLAAQHGARAHALTTKAIDVSAKTVLRNLKAAPEGQEGIAAGGPALSNLDKLLADAKRSGNQSMVASLRKDIETGLKTTRSRIVKLAEAAPPSQATQASSTAVQQLWSLAQQAQKQGSQIMQLSLMKDVSKTVTSWHSAIQAAFQKAQGATATREKLKIATQNIATIHSQGAGAKLATSATDQGFLKAQEADQAKAIGEMEKERGVIAKLMARERSLIAKLRVKEKAAAKHHQKGVVKALVAEIKEIEAQVGEGAAQSAEIGTSIEEAKVNVAELQAEYEKSVYEAFKKTISEADEVFQAHLSSITLSEVLAEGKLHRAGLDFSGLEEAKSKQEGVLTPQQIAQANADYAQFRQAHEAQIQADREQLSHDQAVVGSLGGEDRSSMEATIRGLIEAINGLENQIYDQGKATTKLTEATNSATKTFGGLVGFNFQGQDYVVGSSQSSVSGADVMVGV